MSTLHMVVSGHRDIRPEAKKLFWVQAERWLRHAVTKHDKVNMHNGMAHGMDSMFKWVADHKFAGQINVIEHKVTSAQWKASRGAGHMRNKRMVDQALTDAKLVKGDVACLVTGLYSDIEWNAKGGTIHCTNYAIKKLGMKHVHFMYPRQHMIDEYYNRNTVTGQQTLF